VNTFLGKLHSFIEEPLELVLYLGAGSFADLPKSRALTIKHLVLVEGDPHLAGQIARSLGNEISSQVLPVLLTPHGAKTTFYRYNLPFLNGVLPLGDLQSLYPRLKVVEELELASTTLSALFQTIPLAGEGKRLLIMDIPGQETAILESVNPQQLQGFDWILLRGCRAALQQGAQPLAMGIARLEGSLFEKVYRDEESDPDWPVGLLHLDRRKVDFNHEMERSLRRLGEMTHASQEQARRIAEVESQLKSSLSELDDARTQLGELNTRIVVMEEAKALALREAADREAAVQAELGNRTRLLEEKAAESQQRAQRVAEFELQLRSSQSELDDARRQLGELNQKIAEMAETKAQALKEAADREAAVQSELTHRIWLLDVKVSENQERTQRIAELDAQIANDARLLEERATNLRTANERLSSLESEAAAHKTLVEVLGKGRSQQDKLYKELSQEKDGLRAEIERLNRRIFELEALVASKETHENLLDIEFQKVEGQIELIKEIFLQERR
jgi:hypothetical protein